jgi:Respiratory-chain NADH dehydrogenase 51 Kd subunit
MPPWTSHPAALVSSWAEARSARSANTEHEAAARGLRVARSLGPRRTAEEVTLSGLRGRGGGGFRIGRKWLSVLDAARDDERPFVVANGAEGEPGNFKDRAILRHNPYQVIEGLAIAALAVRASPAFWPSSPPKDVGPEPHSTVKPISVKMRLPLTSDACTSIWYSLPGSRNCGGTVRLVSSGDSVTSRMRNSSSRVTMTS